MSDHVQRASEDAAPSKLGWLDGRASRREYWLWVAPLMVVDMAIAALVPAAALFAVVPISIAVFLVTIRRFHDFGWSGFAVPLMNVGFGVCSLALRALLDKSSAALVTLVLSFAVLVAVGAWPGQLVANRYGPPRRGKDVGEVFS